MSVTLPQIMMIVIITLETIVGMMSIAVMMMTMEKDIC